MPASKKKPATKKKVPNRPASMAKKTAKGKSTDGQSKGNTVVKARRQTASVLIFAAAILLFCMVIIPGGSLWGVLHRFLLGLFGICAYILPVLMVYISVIIALDKPVGSVSGKMWQCVSLITMIASAIHVFSFDITTNYFAAIGLGYTAGKANRGGGVMGVLLGYPLEYFFTDVGAKIIILLLIAVFLMLVTGTTVAAVLRAASTPVKKAKESIETAMIAGQERRRGSPVIDIDMGDGYDAEEAEEDTLPAHPVRSPAAPPKNEKLEALGRAARELQEEPESAGILPAEKLPSTLDIALDDIAGHPPVPFPLGEDAGAGPSPSRWARTRQTRETPRRRRQGGRTKAGTPKSRRPAQLRRRPPVRATTTITRPSPSLTSRAPLTTFPLRRSSKTTPSCW